MADKIETKDVIYVIKRVNYGEDQSVQKTTQIIQVVDPDTLQLKSSQITHDGIADNGANLKDIIDDLLYQAIQITSFLLNGYRVLVQEMGNTLTELSFVWNYNKEVVLQSITDIELDAEDRAVTIVEQDIETDTTWTLMGNDGSRTVTANASVIFTHSLRWIAMTEQEITSSILNTWNYVLKSTLNHVFTVNAGAEEYIYFCYPQSYGVASFWIGGFEEIFEVTEFSYENQYGVIEDYYICKSENKGLGSTTVTVTLATTEPK
jgi:hypothetical protein